MLRMSGIRLGIVDGAEADTGGHAASRIHWGPHIDFLQASDLIRPTADHASYSPAMINMGQLCVVYSQRQLKNEDRWYNLKWMEKDVVK